MICLAPLCGNTGRQAGSWVLGARKDILRQARNGVHLQRRATLKAPSLFLTRHPHNGLKPASCHAYEGRLAWAAPPPPSLLFS